MTLKRDAHSLVQILRDISRHLERYGDDYTSHLAVMLDPHTEALAMAIDVEHSIPHAREIIADIAPILEEINGAATKGDMSIFPDPSLLDEYWNLRTIFQESRYANETI